MPPNLNFPSWGNGDAGCGVAGVGVGTLAPPPGTTGGSGAGEGAGEGVGVGAGEGMGVGVGEGVGVGFLAFFLYLSHCVSRLTPLTFSLPATTFIRASNCSKSITWFLPKATSKPVTSNSPNPLV